MMIGTINERCHYYKARGSFPSFLSSLCFTSGVFIILCMFILMGCATTPISPISKETLRKLNFGMTKDELITLLGEPDYIIGTVTNWQGQTCEMWLYNTFPPYFLFDERGLVFWGGWPQYIQWRDGPDQILKIEIK